MRNFRIKNFLTKISETSLSSLMKLVKPRLLSRLYSTETHLESIDSKWLKRWDNNPTRHAKRPTRGPYFAMSMFPYPSGNLHIGHLRVYTISDVLARYRRMQGYEVIHPMGFDAFGLPAENAAIERGIDPSIWTYNNITKMKEQMRRMFADFDWERQVITCDPEYYKWTQKLFLEMFETGLAYRNKAEVNWDPVEQTVLANEQVDSEGRSWRSGAIVEKKKLEQWFLGITKFAEELVNDLSKLQDWPEKVKIMQKNWIGLSKGATIVFPGPDNMDLKVYTTRPDTLLSVQYVAVSLDSPIVNHFARSDSALKAFCSREFESDSKEGYELPLKVANPLTPEKKDIPVYVAPYVLSNYGESAVMGCPAHDTRDFQFWRVNGQGDVRPTVLPGNGERSGEELPFLSQGVLSNDCGPYSGMNSEEAGRKIVSDLGTLATPATKMRLRDWLISRQRFWGAPIPIVHCDNCGPVPVPDEQLPVLLPNNLSGPLAKNDEFKKTTCPKCKGPAHRDTDTMDTFMDSSWYFFRYTDAQNSKEPFSYEQASRMIPVDIYIGGVEHAIMHLLYTRFFSKFLASSGRWSGGDLHGEPIRRLVTQGMVHGKTFIEEGSGKFLKTNEVETVGDRILSKITGEPVKISYEKMSKSKYNGADPEECINRHGADATRAHILFQAPVEDVLLWDEAKIVGIKRWLAKVKLIGEKVASRTSMGNKEAEGIELWNKTRPFVRSITDSFEKTLSLNTVISDYMKYTNEIHASSASGEILLRIYSDLLRLMAPVVPATAEELWEALLSSQGKNWTSIFAESWPEIGAEISSDTAQYFVVINGKRVTSLTNRNNLTESELIEMVQNDDKCQALLSSKKIVKTIIPKRGNGISIVAK